MEAPQIEFFSKALVPAFGGGAYIRQVLYGNTKPSDFGFHNDLFGNGVVDYRRGSSFFPLKPFQEFGTTTFAFVNAAFRAFGLNGTTDLVYRKGDNYYTNMECDVEYKTSPPDEYEYVYP